MIDAIDTLITAATLAPSGDNTQPWEFVANRSTSTIAVRLDKTRDSSPMNAGQRMARIACGAAIENILQTAEFNNWSATFKSFTASPLVGVVALTDIDGCQPGAIEQSIRDRCTNRNLYTTSPIPEGFVEEIKNGIEPLGDVSVRWIVRRDIMQIAAESIGDADAAMFGDRRFLLAFLENVRSDLPAQEVAEEGLPVGTLGLSLSERLLLPWLGSLSASRLVRAVLRHAFRRKAVSLASSSAGLCVISVSSEGVEADVAVGRMMQRVWLELTRRGMQVQPMMSLPVLRGFSEWSECACGESPANFKANAFDHCAPELRGAAAILRFGKAPSVTIRTGRRSCSRKKSQGIEFGDPQALGEKVYASV